MKDWRMIHEIKKRLEEGKTVSEVSRELGMDRKTVRKYRDRDEATIRKERKAAVKRSGKLDRFKAWLKERVKAYEADGVVNGESIYRELAAMGYSGSTRTVRRYVSGLRSTKRRRIFEPFETGTGQQAMVDMGERRQVRMGGVLRTMYLIVMVLSYSRRKYGEWHDRPISTELFLDFHQRAFGVLGGVPGEIVYDRTKLAVLQARNGECEFNSDFYALARYCHFTPYICNPYDPQTKGKIESVVRYAKRGFLPGRTFEDAEDMQRQWDEWVSTVADVKPHATTGEAPLARWEEEKKHLQCLPEGRYVVQPSLEKRQVLENGLIKVLGNRYSVPSAYHGKQVLVRVTEDKIHIHAPDGGHVYTHWRCRGHGQTCIIKAHYERSYSIPTAQLEAEVRSQYGGGTVLKVLRERFPRHYREQLKGLIRLGRDRDARVLQQAAERALRFRSLSLGSMERIIRGIEGDRINLPPVAANEGRALGTRGTHLRSPGYYAAAAHQPEEARHE